MFRLNSISRSDVNIFCNWNGMGTGLNKPDPYCQCIWGELRPRRGRDTFQDHWWGSNSFSVLVGMELQSMA